MQDEKLVYDVLRKLLPDEFEFAIQYAIGFLPTDKIGHVTLVLTPEEWTALTILVKAYPQCCPSETLAAQVPLPTLEKLVRKLRYLHRPIKIIPCVGGYTLTNQ